MGQKDEKKNSKTTFNRRDAMSAEMRETVTGAKKEK